MLNFEEQKQRTLSGLMYNDLTSEYMWTVVSGKFF